MPIAIGEAAVPLLLKYGPILAGAILKLAFPDDPILQLWIDMFGKVDTYEVGRSKAFAAAGKTETPLPV
jgi:hypothetical protein